MFLSESCVHMTGCDDCLLGIDFISDALPPPFFFSRAMVWEVLFLLEGVFGLFSCCFWIDLGGKDSDHLWCQHSGDIPMRTATSEKHPSLKTTMSTCHSGLCCDSTHTRIPFHVHYAHAEYICQANLPDDSLFAVRRLSPSARRLDSLQVSYMTNDGVALHRRWCLDSRALAGAFGQA